MVSCGVRELTGGRSLVSKDKLGSSFKNRSKITIEGQDDDIPKIPLFVFLFLFIKMVDLATAPLILTAYYAGC